MAKTASEILVDLLTAAGQPVSLAGLGKQCQAKGVSYATASKAAQALTKRGTIIQVKRGIYSLPVAAAVTTTAAEPAAAVVGVLAPSLGSPCVAPAASAETPKTREALLAVFDADIAYCVNDLMEQLPGWDRALIARLLREAIASEEVTSHYDDEAKANVYTLVREGAAAAERMDLDQARAVLGEIDPQPQPRPVRAAGGGAFLVERVASIASDIEDALGDACDAQLPHDLIKALVVANGAAHRAARLLGV